jgi:hypothetical protein
MGGGTSAVIGFIEKGPIRHLGDINWAAVWAIFNYPKR